MRMAYVCCPCVLPVDVCLVCRACVDCWACMVTRGRKPTRRTQQAAMTKRPIGPVRSAKPRQVGLRGLVLGILTAHPCAGLSATIPGSTLTERSYMEALLSRMFGAEAGAMALAIEPPTCMIKRTAHLPSNKIVGVWLICRVKASLSRSGWMSLGKQICCCGFSITLGVRPATKALVCGGRFGLLVLRHVACADSRRDWRLWSHAGTSHTNVD